VALPFVVIAAVVGWKQLRTLSPAQVERRLQSLRDMSWEPFSNLLADAYRRQGYEVSPAQAATHDFTLTRNGRTTLLLCRRWKVNQLGIAPLKDLAQAVRALDADNGICVIAGNTSENAVEFARTSTVSLVSGAALANLIGRTTAQRK
jgi:restriction system protein